MNEWIPDIGINWDKLPTLGPEAFFALFGGFTGMVVVKWLILIKWIPNWIPILILPPSICWATYRFYMTMTGPSVIPQWSVDPADAKILFGVLVAAAAVLPSLIPIAKHAKNSKKEETAFWTDKPKKRKRGGHKQCDE